ncbi:hypothetical protein COCVIDRAFT_35427 [Bipolaris victoriae FI3]|uniref:CS domain-containing protein n=1 Tax=Bipolaris victoriae (strain FI3) TaxID=930091 RepID=W7F0K8_BIPV3|nr:hypothetical protein COCVIDRAFT_35427 [Bipolaris victoriae FI3]
MTTITPEVFWAQRSSADEPAKNIIYLTIVAPDLSNDDLKLELKDQSLSFKGTSTSKKATYAVDLEFYAEIDTENCKWHNNGRGIELLLRKKEHKQEYWPRLLKESKRQHFLKTDFDKWVDEDEQDEVADDLDTSAMNPMGGGDGGFGGIDFSKLGAGGMGGMPGMEGMDMSQMMANMGGGAPGGDDSDDDDDMPELENDEDNKEKAPAAAASGDKPKIEEVA